LSFVSKKQNIKAREAVYARTRKRWEECVMTKFRHLLDQGIIPSAEDILRECVPEKYKEYSKLKQSYLRLKEEIGKIEKIILDRIGERSMNHVLIDLEERKIIINVAAFGYQNELNVVTRTVKMDDELYELCRRYKGLLKQLFRIQDKLWEISNEYTL